MSNSVTTTRVTQMHAYLDHADEVLLFLITVFKCIVECLYCGVVLLLAKLCEAHCKEGNERWLDKERL